MTDRLLIAAEVAELLAVPVRFVREQTRAGRIPHVRIGLRYVRYRREAIEEWVRENEAGGGIVKARKHSVSVRTLVRNQADGAGSPHG